MTAKNPSCRQRGGHAWLPIDGKPGHATCSRCPASAVHAVATGELLEYASGDAIETEAEAVARRAARKRADLEERIERAREQRAARRAGDAARETTT